VRGETPLARTFPRGGGERRVRLDPERRATQVTVRAQQQLALATADVEHQPGRAPA